MKASLNLGFGGKVKRKGVCPGQHFLQSGMKKKGAIPVCFTKRKKEDVLESRTSYLHKKKGIRPLPFGFSPERGRKE